MTAAPVGVVRLCLTTRPDMDPTSRMLMMGGSDSPQNWEYLGIVKDQTGATLNYPATSQSGDVAFIIGTSNGTVTTPSGWTLVSTGYWYKVCGAGESSVTSPSSTGDRSFFVLLFRPVGGTATLTSSAGFNGTASYALTDVPSLVVLGRAQAGTAATFTPTFGAGYVDLGDTAVANTGVFAGYGILASGSTTGNLTVTRDSDSNTTGSRVSVWHIV